MLDGIKLFRTRRRRGSNIMKKRSCIRMDDLDKDQRKELNTRIKKTVENFNKEIQEDLQQDQEPED